MSAPAAPPKPATKPIEIGEVDVIRRGSQIIIPQDMAYADARLWLSRKEESEEKNVAIASEIECFPLDGLLALSDAMAEIYGFSNLIDTPAGWFGSNPPLMVQISLHDGSKKSAPLGRIQAPTWEGGYIETVVVNAPKLIIGGQVKRKHEAQVQKVIRRTEEILRSGSIYKGHAIQLDLSWMTDGSKFNPIDHAPKFMDLLGLNESDLILNKITETDLKTSVWTIIERTEECQANRIPLKHGLLLSGPYGCLAADTLIPINRAGKSFEIPIWELHKKLKGGATKGKKWDLSIDTNVQHESKDGTIRLTRVTDSWESGVKKTFVLTTNTGRTIRATSEHPFLTESGWKKLGDLKVGDGLHVRGVQKTTGNQRQRGDRVAYASLSVGAHHPFGKGSKGRGFHVFEHRVVFEAKMNGMKTAEFLGRVKSGDVVGLKFLDPDTIVHHKDGDTTNNATENLEALSQKEHASLHSLEFSKNVLYKTSIEKISSIVEFGDEMTYDIEVEGEQHNFVANGIIVHNTGKTLTAKVTAAKCERNGWTFIYLKKADQLAKALKMAELYSPAVLFVEDIDQVAGGDRDAKLNEILNTLDGVDTKGKPIVTILTTNHQDRISPAFLRAGRIDTIVNMGKPDEDAAFRFVLLYAKDDEGRSLIISDVDKAAVGIAMAGLVPAFISEAVQKAKRLALFREGLDIVGKVTTEDLVLAAESKKEHIKLAEPRNEKTEAEKVQESVALLNNQ